MKKISVITPSYNRAGFIRTAVNSVLNQNYPDIEHIIIDGNSTDSTLSILNEYPGLKVVSEPDHGVYDALNKGIKLASGEIIAQLNSDDYFEPHIFKLIIGLFDTYPDIAAISAGARVFESNPYGEKTLAAYNGIKKEEFPFRITLGAPIFNAWFFRKDVFDKIGYYSMEYKLAADREFLLRFYVAGLNHLFVDKIVYHYCQHPLSLTINNLHDRQDRVYKEMIEIANKYLVLSKDHNFRKLVSQWRDRAFIELFASEILRWNLRGMWRTAFIATRKNRMWPLRLISAIPSGVITFLKKRYA